MAAILGDHPGALGLGVTFFREHAVDELAHDGLIQRLIDDDLVFLLRAFAWVNQVVGKIATIRHQQQALALFVQTTDVMEGLELSGQQGVDRHAIPLIRTAADVALRLVQGDDDGRLGAGGFAIDVDRVFGGHDGAEFGHRLAVDRDAAF